MGGTRASQVPKHSLEEPDFSDHTSGVIRKEALFLNFACAEMHFLLITIRKRNVKSRHHLPLIL